MEEKMNAEESAAFEAMQNDTAPEPVKQEDPGDTSDTQDTEDKAEKAPEFKSTREEKKPPEGFVPHQAMHQERTKRQELERKVAELEAKLTPKAEEPEFVDPLENPEGYRKYDEWSRAQALKRVEEWETKQAETQKQQQRFQEASRLEAEFAAQTPDYQSAAQFLHQTRVTELRSMGYADQEISQQIAKDANALFDAASSVGMNPAELLYIRAQRAGYAKAEAQPEGQSEEDKIVQLNEAQRKTQGVSSAGGSKQSGRLTATQLAEMSEAEFDKVLKERPDEVQRAMGG